MNPFATDITRNPLRHNALLLLLDRLDSQASVHQDPAAIRAIVVTPDWMALQVRRVRRAIQVLLVVLAYLALQDLKAEMASKERKVLPAYQVSPALTAHRHGLRHCSYFVSDYPFR